MTNKTLAQQRVDDIQVFRREQARLEQEGVLVLDEARRSALAHHHEQVVAALAQSFDIDRDLQEKKLSLGMRIASLFGALALAASLYFLFGQFWGRFGTTAQVTLLVACALGSLALAFFIRTRDASGYFTRLAALVAFACLVLNVSLLGSIFSITPSDKAFLVWAAYALLLAYAFDLRLLLVAGIVCLIAFVSARTGTWAGMYWLSFGERPENFFPVAALLVLAPAFVRHARHPDFPPFYRIFGLLCLFLPMLVLANWGQASYLEAHPDRIEGGYQVLGFFASALAIWLGAKGQWPETVNTGLVFFIIFLYTKFFDWWWEAMPKYLFFLVIGLSAILLLLVLRRLRAALAGRAGREEARS